MKKILSMIITAAMLLSLAVVMCVPSAAIDGEWIVYSKADHEEPGFVDPMSIPGYEYTNEGLRVIPADWRDFKPGAGVRRKELSDITQGVYMQVRVDEFTYEDDHWFNFNIYSQSKMKPGKTDVDKWGYGVQTLIRYIATANRFDIEWYIGGFQKTATTQVSSENFTMEEDGSVIFDFLVDYDGNTFSASINGIAAPQAVIDYMNDTYTKEEAYVGFNLQNSTKGGKCACTVLLYGTDKETATPPAGEDSRQPENFYLTIADIADASTVEAGKPAVYMNGNRVDSASKNIPTSAGGRIEVNDDYTMHFVAEKSVATVMFDVRNDVSYSIDDFPVAFVLVKNCCTCGADGSCWAVESADMYLMTGEVIGADSQHKVKELPIMSEDVVIIDGEKYLGFYYDMNGSAAPWDAEGRINGVRFDFNDIDYSTPGKNAFDVIYSAFFASVDDATAYTEDYLKTLGWNGEYGNPVTGDGGEGGDVDTDGGADTGDNDGDTEETAGNNGNTEQTNAPDKNETETKAPVSENNGGNSSEKEGGCGSVVGFGAIAIMTLAAGAGFVSFKKRK